MAKQNVCSTPEKISSAETNTFVLYMRKNDLRMSAKAADLQRQVRENADDYQNYLKSLYQWEDEVKIKDEALKNGPKKSINDQVRK